MSHKIAYWLAMSMIFIGACALHRYYHIFNFWERTWVITYMIAYGALMSWSATK